MDIYIIPKSKIQNVDERVQLPRGETAHLSICDPDEPPPRAAFGVRREDHHILYFHDKADHEINMGYKMPEKEDILDILKFWHKYKDRPAILLNCFAGISRSTAIGYIFHCLLLGPGKEADAMQNVEKSCLFSFPHPNERIIRLADDILRRNGLMMKAAREFKESPKSYLIYGR